MATGSLLFVFLVCVLCGNIAASTLPPIEWRAAINNADKLYVNDDKNVDPNNMPMIGNGFVALQVLVYC